MQKCDKCGQPFRWSTIVKSLWLGYKPLTCSNCKTQHYITYKSKIIVTVSTVFPFLVIGLGMSPFDHAAAIFIFALLPALAGSMISTFFITYGKKG